MLLVLIGCVVILTELKLPGDTFLWREISNTGHTPLFGIVSVAVLGLSIQILNLRKRYLHYLFAFVISVIIGVAMEYVQMFGTRDADVGDLIRDLIGIASFLCFCIGLDKQMLAGFKYNSRVIRKLLLAISMMIFLMSFMPVLHWAGGYLYRDHVFPQICSFDSFWGKKFVFTQDAELNAIPPPCGWKDAGTGCVARLTFERGEYPGFRIEEPYPDWTGYQSLTFTIYSELDDSVVLGLRIDDIHYNNTYEDRFNTRIVVRSGVNPVSIPLDKIKNGPKFRELDIAAISVIYLFIHKPENPFTLFISCFELR